MLVSQFELLLNKNQFPKPSALPVPLPEELEQLSREVIQGYFLTISNLSNTDISLVISFRVVSDPDERRFNAGNVTAVFDIDGQNQILSFTPPGTPRRRNYTIDLPAKDTGLLIVQPNPELITNPRREIEIRGFVNVSLQSNDNGEETNILLNPEHRGTFYKRSDSTPPTFDQLDQIVYSLPTPNGGSKFSF